MFTLWPSQQQFQASKERYDNQILAPSITYITMSVGISTWMYDLAESPVQAQLVWGTTHSVMKKLVNAMK